jgi:hypothetical protein
MKAFTLTTQTGSPPSLVLADFLAGTVFGFDLGTVGTAHAVRKGQLLQETGVIECPNETAALASRRKLRNGRRVMDHRQDRRDWFAQTLAGVLGLELHDGFRLPKTAWLQIADGLFKPSQTRVGDPLPLRVAALNGEPLTPEQLFAALSHLVKRRGPARPPWADTLLEENDDENEAPDATRISSDETRSRFEKARAASAHPASYHPCHYLHMLRETKQRQRNHAWPRELMRAEAAAILESQAVHFPALKEKRAVVDVTGRTLHLTTAEWLLRGNAALLTKPEADGGGSFDVFYRNHRNRERAPFTFQAARIHNRGPGLDLIHPRREDGGQNYVMSRSRPDYRAWQIEVALINFKVVDLTSPKKKKPLKKPPTEAIQKLRDVIQQTHQLSLEDLKEWAAPYEAAGQFKLVEGQTDLVGKGEGRGKFGKHGLTDAMRIVRQLQEDANAEDKLKPKTKNEISKNKNEEDKASSYILKQQPEYINMAAKLRFNQRRDGKQTSEPEPLPRALKRYIDEIRDPVVQHRVQLFERLLDELVERHGTPTHIVVECVRELGDDPERAARASERRKTDREENKLARDTLKAMSIEANDKNIRKFRLLQECKWRCPYNPDDRFMQSEFDDLVLQRLVPPAEDNRRAAYLSAARRALNETEIEHMVPQSNMVCDEWFNVTVTRRATNQAKDNRTPYEFVLRDADEETKQRIINNTQAIFGEDSLKFKIFTSPEARSLIDSSANLNRTAYIARCVRYVCLLKFGWLTADGRDPLKEPGHEVNTRYLVSNGGITHRLRKAWKLDELLHEDQRSDEEWKKLSYEEKDEIIAKRRQKNRQDLRHHALDAMILSCTLPWAASSPDYAGGWCHLDPQDGSVSSVACPIFGHQDHGQKIKELAAEKLHALKQGDPQDPENQDRILHYRSNNKHAAVFDTGLYGKRTEFAGAKLNETVFVIRKPLAELTVKSLDPTTSGNVVFSPKLREHIKKAWEAYTSDVVNWQRVLSTAHDAQQNNFAEAKANPKTKPATLRAIEKRLWLLDKWKQNLNPDQDTWGELQTFLHREGGAQQAEAVFPKDFISTLRHPDYTHAPLRRVKVTQQTKDEGSYVSMRDGTYLKYKGGFKCMKVYDSPPGARRGTDFVCWLVRPFYPNPRKLKRRQDLLEENKPDVCKGRKLRATFKGGNVVRFQHDIPGKSVIAGTNWMICSMETKKNNNASFEIVPAHLALNAQDISNPRKSVSSKDTDGEKVSLNDFMRALGYEPAHHPSSES